MTEHAPELDVTHARQGRRGRHALVILVTSLALVIVAFTAVFLTHADDFAGKRGQREAPAQVAQTVTETPNANSQSAASAPAGSVVDQLANSPEAGG